jgi:hypothetical protein
VGTVRTKSRSRASSISSGMCLPPRGAVAARRRDAVDTAAVDCRSTFCRFAAGADMSGGARPPAAPSSPPKSARGSERRT